MRSRGRSPILVAALSLLAGSCKLGPDYERPQVPLPEGWKEIDSAEQASLADVPWWELFQDPALHELIRIALEENKDLAIATERIEETRALYGISRSALFPSVDAFASAGRTRVSESFLAFPGGDQEVSTYDLGASAFWELDFFGRIRRANEAQLALLFAARENRRAVVLALVADVASTYVELRDADQRLAISLRTLESRRAYVELARERYEGGKTSELDWRQAEAELHRTEALVHVFEQLVAESEHELTLLLGRVPGEITRGTATADMPLPPGIPPGLPSALLDRRPDVREAEQVLASSTARIGEAKALLYPSISLTGDLGWASTELEDLVESPSRAWSISANLLQPIFNAGRNRQQVEASESRQRQSLHGYERAILQAFREVEDALAGVRTATERRESQSLRVEAERAVLALAESRYRGGVSDYLEVLDAQRSLFEAELDEAEAVRDQLVFVILLYRALGGGWSEATGKEKVEAAAAGK